MACCKSNLGEFPHNRDINTGLEVTQSGIHEIIIKAANFTRQSLFQDLASGDEIVIPQGTLNENFTFTINVKQPDGTLLTVDDCENLSLTTYVNTIACDDESYL